MDFENCISLRHILGAGVQLIRNGNIADGLEAVEAVIDALNDFIRDVENKELPESYQQQKTVCGGVLQRMMEEMSRMLETIHGLPDLMKTTKTARTPESGFPACGGDNQVAELPEEEIDYFLSGFGVIVTHEAERQQFSRGNDK